MKERTIKIQDLQSTHEGEDAVEITTRGTLKGSPDNYMISYNEDYGDGMKSRTVIRVQDKKCASILRHGDIISEITVEKGKRHNCQYSTPYGDLMLGVYGLGLSSDIGEDGGELRLDYTIDFEGALTAEKRMRITVL